MRFLLFALVLVLSFSCKKQSLSVESLKEIIIKIGVKSLSASKIKWYRLKNDDRWDAPLVDTEAKLEIDVQAEGNVKLQGYGKTISLLKKFKGATFISWHTCRRNDSSTWRYMEFINTELKSSPNKKGSNNIHVDCTLAKKGFLQGF